MAVRYDEVVVVQFSEGAKAEAQSGQTLLHNNLHNAYWWTCASLCQERNVYRNPPEINQPSSFRSAICGDYAPKGAELV